jgi:hypothetical protein
MSAKLALEKYSRRAAGLGKKSGKEKKTKNQSPEKIVEKEVIEWCKYRGFDISVVESKAVFSRAAGRYLRGQTKAGFSDLAGVTGDGTGAFIELKAKGRLGTISRSQFEFLYSKIRRGAFACCVDSADLLNSIYNEWLEVKSLDPDVAKIILQDYLPKQKYLDDVSDDIPW